MRILSRYFLASYLALYCAILFAANLIIIVVEIMLNFDDIMKYREGVWGVATYMFLRLPSYYLPYLVPAASFGAAFLCLGLPARTQELIAIKAGGISPQRVAVPVLAAAACLSVVALVVNETIVLDAVKEFESLDRETDSEALFQSRGSFWYRQGNSLYNVEGADRTSRTLQGISVYERNRQGHLVQSIEAETARIAADDHWYLHNATIRRFDPTDPAAAPQTESVAETVIRVGEQRGLALLNADATVLPLVRLHEYIRTLAEDGRTATRYRAMFHSRLAEPLTVLLFALLAIPIGLAVERSRSLAVAALQGIAVVGIFYGVQTTTAIVAASGVSAAILGPWVLLAVFGGYGAWRFARTPS
ncbi:MAG TPA: LptF/LptG family permease [Myxococcota bacterium]